MAKRAKYRRRFWGGFCDGRLDLRMIDTGFGGFGGRATLNTPAIFGSRAAALREYEDVRPLDVREMPRKSRRATQ